MTSPFKDPVRFVRCTPGAPPCPSRATAQAGGYDLPCSEDIQLYPGECCAVPSGWSVWIPEGYVGLIRDRSGLALRGIITRAGVIDADYRGELKVVLKNDSEDLWSAPAGARIAQLLIVRLHDGRSEEVERASETARGEAGFGSTGV